MASIQVRKLRSGTVYRVHCRDQDKQQRVDSFDNVDLALQYKEHVEKFGYDETQRLLGLTATRIGETLKQVCENHIAHLTGVEGGTIVKYKGYVRNDLALIGDIPVTLVTETTISTWIQWLEQTKKNAGKTIANKHGFLSAALARAVRDKKIPENPCDQTRLPNSEPVEEPVFLSRDEFEALRGAMPVHWHPLMTWLVATGTRFSEATALTVSSVTGGTCRISNAWKYTGTKEARLAYPKSKAGRRTINLPTQAMAVIDLDRPAKELLFTNRDGERVTYSRFYDGAWKPAVKATGIKASPHDLRHTCASWMIAAGVPLPVIQKHFGHESITVTIGVYGHLDRSSHAAAADAISAAMG